jgi:hypothetical protein
MEVNRLTRDKGPTSAGFGGLPQEIADILVQIAASFRRELTKYFRDHLNATQTYSETIQYPFGIQTPF